MQRLLARVETAAMRAGSLIRTLADSQSIARGAFDVRLHLVDLRGVVEPVACMMERISDRHPIVLVMDQEALFVECDPERLGSVVENLIANAIKYSPGGSEIDVSVEGTRDHAVIAVRDYGIGIPAESREQIFAEKYRVPTTADVAPGLGLGLHIVSEIVKRHGGRIEVDSGGSLGRGTAFTVRLPRLQSAASKSTSLPPFEGKCTT